MIEIKITDPHLMDKGELFKLAKYLFEVSGNELRKAPVSESAVSAPETKIIPLSNIVEGEPNFNLPSGIVPPPPLSLSPLVPSQDTVNPFAPLSPTERDIHGLPWDGRIHSRTKSKTADGAWKLQRGIDPNLVDKIRAETSFKPPVLVDAPRLPELIENPYNFEALMTKITDVVTKKKITSKQILNIVQSFGLPSIHLAGTREDLIPAIMNEINKVLGE